MMTMVVLILFGSFAFTRYLGVKTMGSSSGKNMKIIDTLVVSPEKSIVVVEVLGKFYMMGISNNGINLIKELEEYPLDNLANSPESFQKSIQDALSKYKKK